MARQLADLNFRLVATVGTASVLQAAGVAVEPVAKVIDGVRPHVVDKMKSGEIGLVINTPEGQHARLDSYSIRRTAVSMGIPYFTTMAAAQAAVEAIRAMRHGKLRVKALQEYHEVRGAR